MPVRAACAAGLLLLVGCAPMICADPLARAAHALADEAAADHAHLSLLAVTPDGEELVAIAPDTRSLPASTVKLAATLTALERLGPDFRFETRVEWLADGAVPASGWLRITPSGDPTLGSRHLPERPQPLAERLADAVAARAGALWTGDVSISGCSAQAPCDPPWLGDGWSHDDLGSEYSAPRTRFIYRDNLEGPPLERLRRDLAAALFARGVAWRATSAVASAEPEALWSEKSAPLAVIAALTNKRSLNLYAEALAFAATQAAIAAEPTSTQPTSTQPAATLHAATSPAASMSVGQLLSDRFLTAGAAPASVSLFDGSGLSRYNALTARALVALIRSALAGEQRDSWLASLAVNGIDGTLRRRAGRPGFVFAKTGTLTGQRALAGIAYRPKAKQTLVIFALLIGNHPGDVASTNRGLDRWLDALTTTD